MCDHIIQLLKVWPKIFRRVIFNARLVLSGELNYEIETRRDHPIASITSNFLRIFSPLIESRNITDRS